MATNYLGQPPALMTPQPQQGEYIPAQQPPMMDPKRALWGGLIMDIGNFVGSKGQRPMQGLGPRMMMQAEQQNYARQQYAAATAEGRRRWETEQAMKWLQGQQRLAGGGPNDMIGKVNPRDYTEESLAAFYSDLEQNGQPNFNLLERVSPSSARERMLNDYRLMTGNPDATIADLEGAISGGRTAASQAEQMRPQLIQTLTTTAPLIDELSGFISSIETDGWMGGPIRGRVMQYFNSELARMSILNTYQTLAQLGVQNLAPVSNFEIGLLSDMFADPDMTEAQITAALNLTRDKMRHNQRMAQEQLDYMDKHGDLRNYRPSTSAPTGSVKDIAGETAEPAGPPTTPEEEEDLFNRYN